ncbi:hypothetical protein LTS18_010332 [Coniosporium uncinatum]|uniref:Uncharacterized protein n=1 Tax=Coniosporium uncinatum TaxID=93489 RepID=A0ACC3DWY6_9PEZI|nr:hypothetical protein LTS18_010332 [Coniosporium uncinatum]
MSAAAGSATPVLDTRLIEINKLTSEIEENWPDIPLVRCLPQCMLPIMIEAAGSAKRVLADGLVENPEQSPMLYFRGLAKLAKATKNDHRRAIRELALAIEEAPLHGDQDHKYDPLSKKTFAVALAKATGVLMVQPTTAQLTPLQCIAEVELDWDVRLGVEGEWLPKELLILNKPRKQPGLTKSAERKKNDKTYEDLGHYPVEVLRELQEFAAAQSGAEKARKARRYMMAAATNLDDVKQLTVDVVREARKMMDAEERLPRKRGRDEQKEERRTKACSEPPHEKVEAEAEVEAEVEDDGFEAYFWGSNDEGKVQIALEMYRRLQK